MAEYIWEIPDETPKEWNRNTVADGKWLNKNTIIPLMNRDNKLLSLIEEQGEKSDDDYKKLLKLLEEETVNRITGDDYILSDLENSFDTVVGRNGILVYPENNNLIIDQTQWIDPTDVSAAIERERQERIENDSYLDYKINNVYSAISTERDERIYNDGLLWSAVSSLNYDLYNISGDLNYRINELSGNWASEYDILWNALSGERTERISADDYLNEKINIETQNRIDGDIYLTRNINTLATYLSNEIETRKIEDGYIWDALSIESNARKQADLDIYDTLADLNKKSYNFESHDQSLMISDYFNDNTHVYDLSVNPDILNNFSGISGISAELNGLSSAVSSISSTYANRFKLVSTSNAISITSASQDNCTVYDLGLNLDETKYGILENSIFVPRNSNNWSFTNLDGKIKATDNIITGLTKGRLYHVTCDFEYNVTTPLDGYTRATLVDNTIAPHVFMIDLSLGPDAIIPGTISYDFVAYDNNYTFIKWSTEDTVDASLCIKRLYIHEVAADIINSAGGGSQSIDVKTYGISQTQYITGNNEYRKIYLNGNIETSDGSTLPIKSATSLSLDKNAKYNCVASLSFININVLDAFEICKIKVPFNDTHNEVMTYTFDCGIEYTDDNPLTINVAWQSESCSQETIEVNMSTYWRAKLNYIHITEIK